MPDPIVFGSPVLESGVEAGAFAPLPISVWYDGSSLADQESEVDSSPSTFRSLDEEGGSSTVAANPAGGTQARIILEGVWDVVFIDSFDEIEAVIPECSLVLQVFEEDGETLDWEVGTSPSHPNPYLCLPENYGAQELDIIAGAATIGQVEVIVIDKSQIVGDQDSGWMTEKLSIDGIPAIRDRRCRLVRYIGPELGYVTIADGPADVPRLDDSYSAYRWMIRDVRETERKIRSFTRSNTWILPMGLENGWGQYEVEEETEWLVPPTDPLVGTYTESELIEGVVSLDDYWPDALSSNHFPTGDSVSSREVELTEAILDLDQSEVELISIGEPSGLGRLAYHTWPNIQILWRPEGSMDDWNVVDPEGMRFLGGATYPKSVIPVLASSSTGLLKYKLPDDTEILAASKIFLRGSDRNSTWDGGGYSGTLVEGTFPSESQRVEIAVLYVGEPTESVPLYVEFDDDGVTRMTAGRLLQKAYDGEYSERDLDTGDPVPTGIRYSEEDLLQMDTTVLLRMTEPVEDLRAWAETKVYAPTGWAPSLDEDLAISPSSQETPSTFDGLPVLNDDNVEPVPSWNAGETIINLMEFQYPRWYNPGLGTGSQASSVDNLESRSIVHTYRSLSSIARKEEKVSFDGEVFGAIGDTGGGQIAVEEVGFSLSQDRKLYVFDRYNTGAQTIEIPVRRSESTSLIIPGQWVVIDLSWLPDYVLLRRGASWGGQIVAIHDVDCAWRIFLIEEAVPLIIS